MKNPRKKHRWALLLGVAFRQGVAFPALVAFLPGCPDIRCRGAQLRRALTPLLGIPAPCPTLSAPSPSPPILPCCCLPHHPLCPLSPPPPPCCRVKFAEATVRRKGQVQEVRASGPAYGGEATGIKSRLSKSVRL